jgi:hypothetical protein
MNQSWHGKMEIRGENLEFDPTSLLIISLSTIDTESLEPSLIGYVNFPLFMDKTTKRPVTQSVKPDNMFLQRGAF